MASQEDKQGTQAPAGGGMSSAGSDAHQMEGAASDDRSAEGRNEAATPTVEDTYTTEEAPPSPQRNKNGGAPPSPPAPPDDNGGGDEDEGMLRMSFLEHLEELRRRLLYCLMGVGVAFLACLIFANDLWLFVQAPAADALTQLGMKDPRLAQIAPMEVFSIVWVKLPILAAIFLASPWVLYQVWAFIAPGLYRRERRWAAPFVICSAGLFIVGGLFAYFIAFRFGLVFLLGIGRDIHIQPVVSVTEYFDLFVNVMLGIGLVFELPVLIFFLTLLRIVSPAFLMRNVRYAILGIVIIAAIVTPTPDVFNLMLFAVPMILLFFLGVFGSYLLVLKRENRRFPWKVLWYVVLGIAALVAAAVYIMVTRYGYHVLNHWPFLSR